MKPLSLSTILKVIGIENNTSQVLITYVGDNIQKIKNHSVIFHLNKNRSVNLTKFQTLKHCYIITDQPLIKNTIPIENCFFVPNIKEAYSRFVKYYRSLFNLTVISVTGTCGKTTTKEMIAQVLKNKYRVVHTLSSKNALNRHNDYLMQIDDTTDFAVLETALTHPGHIIHTCEYFKPKIGVITTIGIDHLNQFENLDNYIRAKAELLTGLNNQGMLVINNDDDNIKKIDMRNYRGKIITIGINNKSDFMASNIAYAKNNMTFTLSHKKRSYPVQIKGLGVHNVYNALCATAALSVTGLSIEEIITYLGKYQPIQSHTEPKQGINGSLIIDDTWSSNPTSMNAALRVVKDLGINKRKIAVIGKISYLGAYETDSYQKVARMLMKNKIDILVTQDTKAKIIGDFLIKQGFNPQNIYHCSNKQVLLETLKRLLTKDTIALFKWSMLDKTNQDILQSLVVN